MCVPILFCKLSLMFIQFISVAAALLSADATVSPAPTKESATPKTTSSPTPTSKSATAKSTASPAAPSGTTNPVSSEISKPASQPETRQEISFLHMTDLHVSENRPYSLDNLRTFCDSTYPSLIARGDVLFLAMTGDFTDGMGSFLSLSQFGQQESDWAAFRSALQGCIDQGVPIFKIRGNHDTFGVESFKHASNAHFTAIQEELEGLLVKSSLQMVAHHDQSGSFALFHPASKSRFVFLDAGRTVPSPHQYHGEFSEEQEKWLAAFMNGPTNAKALSTYIFVHYPLGCLTPSSRERLLRTVDRSSSRVTFLSGHIHSLIGKRGVQAIQSHGDVDELQLSDFKWSGAVRKVDVTTGLFVDIPMDGSLSATMMLDPDVRGTGNEGRSLIGIYAPEESIIDSASRCDDSTAVLRPGPRMGGMAFFGSPSSTCVDVTLIDTETGKRSSNRLVAADTRLTQGSLSRYAFSYFFETLHVVLLLEYVILVVIARSLFLKFGDLGLTLYLILSPLIPTTVSENFFSRPWVVSNGVMGIDLESNEVFIDYETIRTGVMMLLYLLFALAVRWGADKRGPSFAGKLAWTVSLAILSFVDMRMMIARGGFKTLTLSPHTWFMVYMWCLWINQGKSKID
jgi:hypothetical protein